MIASFIADPLLIIGVYYLFKGIVKLDKPLLQKSNFFIGCSNAVWAIDAYMRRDFISGAISAVLAAWCFWSFFHNNDDWKRKKKKLRDLGNKAKAKIKEMVDNMTPSPIPSPIGA